jgi:hypothetical protein
VIKYTGQELVALRKALEKGERLTDRQVVVLAALKRGQNAGRRFLGVARALDLLPGEEIFGFLRALEDAVWTNRSVLADGSLDAWLVDVYSDAVVVRDFNTGKFFRAPFSRATDGTFAFGTSVEVRSEWVPVTPSAGEQVDTQRAAAPTYAEIPRSTSRWGFLPETLRAE